jgi:hypothetical protein
MNNNNNLLDHLLQKSIEEAQFAFKEDYWDKMETLLDEEEKNKKRPFFWRWISIFLGVVVVGGATLLYSKLHSKSEMINAKVDNTIIEQAKNKNLVVNDQATEAPDEIDIQNQRNQNEGQELKNLHSSNNKLKKDDLENSKSKNSSLPTQLGSAPQHPILQKEVETIKEKRTETASSKIEATKKINTKYATSKTELPAMQHRAADFSQKDITIIQGKPMIQISAESYPQSEPRDETKFNPRYNAALKNYIPEKYDSITILTYKSVDINVQPKSESNPQEQVQAKDSLVLKPMNLMMLAGLNMNKGFDGTLENGLKWGYAPYIAVGVEKPISNKITMSSHVGFTYFNGLNVHKTVSSTVYSFGLDSSAIAVYYKKQLQLYLPISVYYQMKPKHFLMASIGASYSMNVLSTYEAFKSTSSGFNSTTNKINTTSMTTSTKNQLGYQAGIKQLDVFLQAGYSYQVFKNCMIQLGIQKGLFDVTKNTYFNNSIKNTQNRLSVGIKYSFNRNNN